jgi:hypothetical protein
MAQRKYSKYVRVRVLYSYSYCTPVRVHDRERRSRQALARDDTVGGFVSRQIGFEVSPSIALLLRVGNYEGPSRQRNPNSDGQVTSIGPGGACGSQGVGEGEGRNELDHSRPVPLLTIRTRIFRWYDNPVRSFGVMRKYLMGQRHSFPSQDDCMSECARESHSLASIGSARHLDKLIVDVTLRALVHALEVRISETICTIICTSPDCD